VDSTQLVALGLLLLGGFLIGGVVSFWSTSKLTAGVLAALAVLALAGAVLRLVSTGA
jgi:hypothetical protein